MSEKPSKINSSHYGIAGFDPEARIISKEQKKLSNTPINRERRKLKGKITDSGFFDESSLIDSSLAQKPISSEKHENSSYKIEHTPNPKIPVNYKWINGEFRTGPFGSDVGEFAGRLEGRVKIVSPGKKLRVSGYNGIGSINGKIIEVTNPKDRQFLGKSGWWDARSLSKENGRRQRKHQ
jgi:hypothetical protein